MTVRAPVVASLVAVVLVTGCSRTGAPERSSVRNVDDDPGDSAEDEALAALPRRGQIDAGALDAALIDIEFPLVEIDLWTSGAGEVSLSRHSLGSGFEIFNADGGGFELDELDLTADPHRFDHAFEDGDAVRFLICRPGCGPRSAVPLTVDDVSVDLASEVVSGSGYVAPVGAEPARQTVTVDDVTVLVHDAGGEAWEASFAGTGADLAPDEELVVRTYGTEVDVHGRTFHWTDQHFLVAEVLS